MQKQIILSCLMLGTFHKKRNKSAEFDSALRVYHNGPLFVVFWTQSDVLSLRMGIQLKSEKVAIDWSS